MPSYATQFRTAISLTLTTFPLGFQVKITQASFFKVRPLDGLSMPGTVISDQIPPIFQPQAPLETRFLS